MGTFEFDEDSLPEVTVVPEFSDLDNKIYKVGEWSLQTGEYPTLADEIEDAENTILVWLAWTKYLKSGKVEDYVNDNVS